MPKMPEVKPPDFPTFSAGALFLVMILMLVIFGGYNLAKLWAAAGLP